MGAKTKEAETGAFENGNYSKWLPAIVAGLGILLIVVLIAAINIERGTIEVSGVPTGSSIFINESRQLRSAPSGVIEFSLPPETHTIMIARDDFWPWREQVAVSKNTTVNLAPFFVARNPEAIDEVVNTPATPSARVATSGNPIRSADDTTTAWINDRGRIIARENGGATSTVYKASPVQSIDFWPGRSDILIFSDWRGVYAIEVDAESIQNFQPLLRTDENHNISFVIQTNEAEMYALIRVGGEWFRSPLLPTDRPDLE